jgi:CRP-like cAMP-binding protein
LPSKNRLLRALGSNLDELRPHLTHAQLPQGHVLAELDQVMDRVFFPTKGVISNRVGYELGEELEVVFTGYNNAIGVNEVIGVPGALRRVCLTDCEGWFVSTRALAEVMKSAPAAEATIRDFWQTQIQHVIQTSICNRIHTAEQRFSRWTLLLTELISETEIQTTQDELATILGIRRSYLNPVIHRLRKEGVLEIQRKRLRVLNFPLLQKHACECHPLLRRSLIGAEPLPEDSKNARPGSLASARPA